MDRPRSMARCSFTLANLPGGTDETVVLDALFADGAPCGSGDVVIPRLESPEWRP
jgi:hypothetical protein